jgi:hypothetical protein
MFLFVNTVPLPMFIEGLLDKDELHDSAAAAGGGILLTVRLQENNTGTSLLRQCVPILVKPG